MPWDFNRMQYKDYILLQAGFVNKRRYDQRMLRRVVAMLLEPYAAKGQNISEYRIWPIAGDEELRKREQEYRQSYAASVEPKALKVLAMFKEKERLQKSKDN